VTAIPTLAMPWFTPEGWQQLKAVADDAQALIGTHEEFVRKTAGAMRMFKKRRIAVEKFTIDVDHMTAWCRRHGHRIDSRGRAMYGALLALHDGKLFDLDTPMEMPDRTVH
jgi:hypothetical protein